MDALREAAIARAWADLPTQIQAHPGIKALHRAALAALAQPAAPDAQPDNPACKSVQKRLAVQQPDAQPVQQPDPAIEEALTEGEFKPRHWTVSACRAIEQNPSGALNIIQSLKRQLAAAQAAQPAPQPLTITPREVVRQVFEVCEDFEATPESPGDTKEVERFKSGVRFASNRIRNAIGDWLTEEERAAGITAAPKTDKERG